MDFLKDLLDDFFERFPTFETISGVTIMGAAAACWLFPSLAWGIACAIAFAWGLRMMLVNRIKQQVATEKKVEVRKAKEG